MVESTYVMAGSRRFDHDMEPAPVDGQTWPDAVAGDAADPADAGEVVPDDPDG